MRIWGFLFCFAVSAAASGFCDWELAAGELAIHAPTARAMEMREDFATELGELVSRLRWLNDHEGQRYLEDVHRAMETYREHHATDTATPTSFDLVSASPIAPPEWVTTALEPFLARLKPERRVPLPTAPPPRDIGQWVVRSLRRSDLRGFLRQAFDERTGRHVDTSSQHQIVLSAAMVVSSLRTMRLASPSECSAAERIVPKKYAGL